MVSRSTVRLALAVGVAALATACAVAKSTPGEDPRSGTNASMVTWADGKEAIAITCNEPGACQTRAVAMCNRTNGDYTVLKMENMPTRGDLGTVRGAASAVVRCGR